jgi:filamentous hemagglutinin family protein
MNKAYRLIWSRAKDAWVIAAEIVKGNGGPPPITVSAIIVAASLALAVGGADALPVNPTVVSGTVNFGTTGNTLTVTNSANSIINWQAFSIAANESVWFNQQSALSAVLNRVTGIDPSRILGSLQSNGKVFLINPNGVIFGQGSRIDAAGMVASSLGITNQDFLAGNFRFTGDSTAGAVKNQGAITTTAGGMVWLISPNVENSGVITSPNGSVMLAAGQSVYLVDPQKPEIAVVVSAPANQAVNMGTILTQGGSAGIFGSLVSQQGVINADSAVAGENGRIFLKSTTSTTLGANSVISANALDKGDGGRIVVLSDGETKVDGTISATGGPNGGKGGFIETSAPVVNIAETAQVTTKTGTWLIDPLNITIAASGGNMTGAQVSDGVQNNGTFTIDAVSPPGTAVGDIYVRDAISWDNANTLQLLASRNIGISAAITGANGTLSLSAPGTTTQSAPITVANLELLRGTFTLRNSANAIGTLVGDVTAVNLFNNKTLTVGTVGSRTGLNASGDIRLEAKGQAGYDGIRVVDSNISGANVYIKGTGGSGTTGSGGTGVYTYNSGITASKDLTIKGFGGSAGSSYGRGGDGVSINYYSTVKAAGTLAITGQGGDGGAAGGNGGYGVRVSYSYLGAGKDVAITGIGGKGGGGTYGYYGSTGVSVTDYSSVRAQGNITIKGTGGAGGSGGGDGGIGVRVGYYSTVSAYGNLAITGQGGAGDALAGGSGGAGVRVTYSYLGAGKDVAISGTGGKGGAGSDGGYGVVIKYDSNVVSYGNITIKGIGGAGGDFTATSSNSYAGDGGFGIRLGSGSYIKSYGTSDNTISLVGTGGKGGNALNTGTTNLNSRGGSGGEGIIIQGQIGYNYSYANVNLIGTGGAGGNGTGGKSAAGTGGFGRGGYGGYGITMSGSSDSWGRPTGNGHGSIYAGYGSITMLGRGGAGGHGTGGTGNIGGDGHGGGGGYGISTSHAVISAYGSAPISLTGIGGKGGNGIGGKGTMSSGAGTGGNGGKGISLGYSYYNSYSGNTYLGGNSTVISTDGRWMGYNPITLTGTGGAGGSGSGSSNSYGGKGGVGIGLYNGNAYQVLGSYAAITLNARGGASGASAGAYGVQGGDGLEIASNRNNGYNAIHSGSSVKITTIGGAGGIGSVSNGSQGNGLCDHWAGAEGAVSSPKIELTTQGGANLYNWSADSIVINNSGSGDIYFQQGSYSSGNGLTVKGANSAPGGGFTVRDYQGEAVTLAGIRTSNGPVNIETNYSDVIFTGAINAGSSDVTIGSSYGGSVGAIFGLASGGSAINAGSATLYASNGIGTLETPLVTTVNTLTAENNWSGEVWIKNTGALTVNSLSNYGGQIYLENWGGVNLTGAGVHADGTPLSDITIKAHSPITVSSPMSATGNIYLFAGPSGQLQDTVTFNNTVTAGGNITVTAGEVIYNGVLGTTVIPGGNYYFFDHLNPYVSLGNTLISTMGRESTDLTEDDNEIYQGANHGDESGKVSYCN